MCTYAQQALLFLLLIFITSCGNQEEQKGNDGRGTESTYTKADYTVYITATGEKYHEEDCRFLKKSKLPIALSEAIRLGYEACKVCEPPKQ